MGEPAGQAESAAAHDPSGHASGAARRGAARREAFEAFELAAVLSHYDTGVIDQIGEFRRGSAQAPKVVIRSERGVFLLKRRAPGRDDPQKAAFAHTVQLHLARRGFSLPRLLGDRRDNNSLVRLNGRTYELFEYVQGEVFDGSPDAAEAAGRELARLHRLLADFEPGWTPPAGSYHNAPRLFSRLDAIPERIAAESAHSGVDVPQTVDSLREAYTAAANAAEEAGVAAWPRQVIHGDWHPGNMLFRGREVVSVLDYDSARLEPRALDVANGALQFSIATEGDDPGRWPEEVDEARFQRFCKGYDHVEGCTISTAEIVAMPHLMIEALIVEAAAPIAATGSFAGMEGGAFLRMVERKVGWLRQNTDRLRRLVGG